MKYASSPAGRALVRKLGLDTDNKQLVHDASCGLHSGVPACCVAFWITVYLPANAASDTLLNAPVREGFIHQYGEHGDDLRFSFLVDYADMLDRNKSDCVLCPGCLLAGRVVKTKPCHCYRRKRKARTNLSCLIS